MVGCPRLAKRDVGHPLVVLGALRHRLQSELVLEARAAAGLDRDAQRAGLFPLPAELDDALRAGGGGRARSVGAGMSVSAHQPAHLCAPRRDEDGLLRGGGGGQPPRHRSSRAE